MLHFIYIIDSEIVKYELLGNFYSENISGILKPAFPTDLLWHSQYGKEIRRLKENPVSVHLHDRSW